MPRRLHPVVLMALLLLPALARADADEDLIAAILGGDDAGVSAALRDGADANARSAQSLSALMLAAERGQTDTLRTLLAAGADANATRSGGVTPLMHAAASGEPAAVRLLLDAHADVNVRSARNGVTALRVAVVTGSVDSARALLAAGADPDELDDAGARLLFAAAGAGSTELIDLFLPPGADINHRRRDGGYTALDVALERQHWAAALHLLRRGATLDASVTGRGSVLRKLLELAPVVQPGSQTPLVQAVPLPELELFQRVLAQGADTRYRDEKGNTLLMLAARRHHVTALQALVGAGVDVDARNAEGDTALSIAAGKTEYELVVMGLGLALQQDREALMRLAFHPAQKSSESPSTARRLEAARVLLAAHANPNSADLEGDTPLLRATRSGDAELVALLIAAGADVDARSAHGSVPILVAAQMGLEEIAASLIGARANLAVKDVDGRTLVELARRGGHEKVVRLLTAAQRS